MLKWFIAILLGAGLGILASRYLWVGSWLSLILWAIVGLALGAWSPRRQALINGATFGFVVAFIFTLSGYAGSASMISRLPFFAIVGLVGGVCGLVLGLLGSLARERLHREAGHPD